MPGTSSPSPLVSHTFFIPALDCPEEFVLIDRGLAGMEGVQGTLPDYLERSLRVQFNPDTVDVEAIEQQLRRIGFPSRSPPSPQAGNNPTTRLSGIRWPTVASGAWLAIGAALYFAGFHGLELRLVLITATLTAGWSVGRAAWRALRLRSIDMNVLMSLAAVGAIATGDYFEAATAMFLFAVSLGLESLTLDRARHAVRSLVQLRPTTAHRLCSPAGAAHDHHHGQHEHEHGHGHGHGQGHGHDHDHDHDHEHKHEHEHEQAEHPHDCADHQHATDIDPTEILVGDLLLVRPGERIPVDGTVESGTAWVNEAPITGESQLVEKGVGAVLFAGALNGEGTLEMRARTTSEESTLAHIARLVEQARGARSPTERFVDLFARRYTPAVVLIACLIAFLPPVLAELGVSWAARIPAVEWLHRGLVLLVIACPCALVISTPVTILCGLHQATRLGMLVKGGEFLEAVGRLRCIALDKTGTLTEGRPQVVDVVGLSGVPPTEVLRVAAGLEAASEHPLAAAIVLAAQQQGCYTHRAQSATTSRGTGMVGEIDGRPCFAGSVGHAREQTGQQYLPEELLRGPAGATLVVVGRGQQLLGSIFLSDRPRSDAQRTIEQLHQLHLDCLVMLTGDRRSAAERLGAELGIRDVQAELLPDDKVRLVKQLVAQYGTVAMVGDGVNDAPALAAAQVGMAFGAQASDTALETADIVCLSPHLRRVPDLIRLGRRTRDILAQNIAFALTIKVGVLFLATIGLGTLWSAVVADVGASVLVVFNGMRVLQPVVETPA